MKLVHHQLSGNHLLTWTAATGNFGKVTLARVGNKAKEKKHQREETEMHISIYPSSSSKSLLLCLPWISLKSPWIPNTHRFFRGCFCYFFQIANYHSKWFCYIILGLQWTAYFKDYQSTSNRWTFLYYKTKEWSRCIPWWQSDLFSGNKKTSLKSP